MTKKIYKTKQRKTMKKIKKEERPELAKKTKKNASRYPKRFHATIEQTNPAELIKRKECQKFTLERTRIEEKKNKKRKQKEENKKKKRKQKENQKI